MIPPLAPGDPVHVLGVAGTAMASLAGLLARSGYRVTGSDAGAYPPMSEVLERERIAVRSPFAPENLPDPCRLVVVGNAVSRGNPELEAALDRRLPLVSFPETLRELVLRGRDPVVVAGTHGKTTTTSLLAFILRTADIDAGYLVGGVAEDLGAGFRLGAPGAPFVVEGDEYDTAYWDKGPKFLHYLPEVAVIGNVEFDHADAFPDFAAVRRAFSWLARLPPRRGLVLLGADCPDALALREAAHSEVQTFGVAAGSRPAASAPDWTGTLESTGPDGTRLAVAFRGEALPPLAGRFWGAAHCRNVLAAAAAARFVGASWSAAREAVAGFRGVARRLEVLAPSEDRPAPGGTIVARDFAHHPTAVRAVLEAAAARWPGAEFVVAFEPRSFTARSARFQQRFRESFRDALPPGSRVLLCGGGSETRGRRPGADADGQGRLDLEALAAGIRADGAPAEAFDDYPPLVERIVERIDERISGEPPSGPGAGRVILFLSNGHFGGAPERVAGLSAGERLREPEASLRPRGEGDPRG